MTPLFKKLFSSTGLTRRGDLGGAMKVIRQAMSGFATATATAPVSRPAPAPAAAAPTAAPFVLAPEPEPEREPAPAATGAPDRFLDGRYSAGDGSRYYKLFVPGDAGGRKLPLLVMLHGCKQDPDDFAAGTRMNELAAAKGLYVLYPAQTARVNPNRCWNWFQPGDQRRGRGEPALIAGMVRQVIAEHAIDPGRVWVAGLSAGGAMAAILAREYPDLFAAAGVHSGLAPGAAHDVASAFAAMRSGTSRSPAAWPGVVAPIGGRSPLGAWPPADAASGVAPTADSHAAGAPLIVFHGDADATVNATNGSLVVESGLGDAHWQVSRDSGGAGGRRWTRTIYRDQGGDPQAPSRAEHWVVHGGGHAWSGGSGGGSFTDPSGPDASREMLRFFREHPARVSRPVT